jgi:catechol 2,3-dioxygenase-like lactoylglutathione lyase family enzyme
MTATAPAAPVPTPVGGRVQLALNVDDLQAAVAFYAALLGTGPAKVRDGYASFAVATPPLKLVLLENPGQGGSLNHLGVEVPDAAAVRAETDRLRDVGLLTAVEESTTCCYATQDKVWATGPDGERWEVYTVLADSATFGAGPATAAPGATCCAPAAETAAATAPTACC